MLQYRGDLKLKKEKCEEVENARKRFEKLNDEYQELLELNKSIRESDERLRVIVAVNKEKLKEKLEELESRIDVYSKKKEKLSQEGKKLKSCPRIAKREVTSIKRIAAELNKLKTTLEAARSAVKTKFKITPHPSKEIYFNLGINGGKLNSHVARTSMEAEDFQRLSFQYPDEFDIDISARLAEIDGIVGIKEATGDLNQISEVIRLCPRDFAVLSGDDFTSMPTVLIGGTGVISVTSNVAPKDMAQMMDAALAGDLGKAKQLHYKLFPLMQAMFYDTNPVPAKKSLELMGKIKSGTPRLPLYPMNDGTLSRLKAALADYGLI